MAGQPRRRAIAVELDIRTRNSCDEDETELDYVSQWVEGGKTLIKLATEIGEASGFDVTVPALASYLRSKFGQAAVDRITSARKASAHTLVEEALEIVDGATATTEGLRHADMRAKSRQWMAERYNRAELGGDRQPVVQINIATLHLDAMRARSFASGPRAFISDGSHVDNPQLGSESHTSELADVIVHDIATSDATVSVGSAPA